MHSTFTAEHELRVDDSRALWNLIPTVLDEQRDRSDRGAEKARYVVTRELVTEHSDSGGN